MFEAVSVPAVFSPTSNGLKEIPFEVLEAFYRFEHFVVLGHQKPDADCVASQLALFKALKRLGKSAQLVSAGPFLRPEIEVLAPDFDAAIDQERIARIRKIRKEDKSDSVLGVILDCSTAERTGFAGELEGLPTLVIDHHASGEINGDICYCDPHSPSTTMLVQNVLQQLPLFLFQMQPRRYAHLARAQTSIIDAEIASALFLGFATDTGFFRFLKPGNAGDMLRLVASLVDNGINLQDVHQHMTGGKAQGTRPLLGLLLLRAGFLLGGKLCVSYELARDKQFWQAESSDKDSFYTLALATRGCEVILLLDEADETENSTGCWNVGLRSLPQHDVGAIAAKFGGGGHHSAAGCRVEADGLQKVLKLLFQECCSLWGLEPGDKTRDLSDYIAAAPRFPDQVLLSPTA